MNDRENVIKGLESLHARLMDAAMQDSVAMLDVSMVANAIALLQDQEAKKVIESTNMYTGLPTTHCPKCGVSIDRYLYGRQHDGKINYCPFCGQELKWE